MTLRNVNGTEPLASVAAEPIFAIAAVIAVMYRSDFSAFVKYFLRASESV